MPEAYVYSAREYGNMLMCLGEARGNASHALRIYRDRFPHVRHPSDSRKITAAFQRVLENRPIAPMAVGGGQQVNVQIEERILNVIRQNPRLGTRSAAKLLRRQGGPTVSHWTVYKVLRRNRMRPYKIHKVQGLLPNDLVRRREYCRWLLDQQQRAPGFIEHVIWMDESTFTRNGMWNRRNAHVWSDVNPTATQETGHQTRWSVNVWAGIFNGRILGPVFLPQRLNGSAYLHFINEQLDDMLDNVWLAELRRAWFQHDGAPPHVTRPVRERLTELFGNRWIGRLGPHAWPARSPDLTPLDFFLWGHVKDRVFDRECDNADEMRGRIVSVFDRLRADCVEDPTLMPRVHGSTQRRARLCIDMDGAQFEPYLIRSQRI